MYRLGRNGLLFNLPSEVASLVLTSQPPSIPFVADVSLAARRGLCADIEL